MIYSLKSKSYKMKIEKWREALSLYDPIYRIKQNTKKTTIPLVVNTKKMTKQG
jgi:hypothetical protein